MKNAILVHGTPSQQEYYDEKVSSGSNAHWFPWLSQQLIIRDIFTVSVEMPHSYNPVYAIWKRELERYDISENTILVGHSCGGGFLLRWLSENSDTKVGKVVLVAPWLDPFGEIEKDFFDFVLDIRLASRTKGITLYHSNDDMESIQRSVNAIKTTVKNIEYREFLNYGHFCESDMNSLEFPELLEDILN